MYFEVKMKIEQEYLDLLLKPLSDSAVPNLKEYLEELMSLGVQIEDGNGRIDRKFETHLRYLSTKRLISNMDGRSDLKALGITIGAGGHIVILGDKLIMQTEIQEPAMPQINIGSINSKQVQVGNHNSQVTNINVQELVEKVAQSDDEEAKSILKSLLENSTVASVVGAGLSGLIGLL
ncbi:hypothetical protein VPR01S_35_00130 [Vibrio proteolyticus NBRC 13287]|uniref:Uncharacterized protein n=2 Tax=Vibrio proteolyticus TaxID=671 RepID=U3BSR9_VIBPR|nr:hypothetical protein VPR01S_35_00130 [Vibrio proteolyticus NBRC 13287]